MARPVPIYTISPAASGFAVLRDGSAIKTPAGNPLALPTPGLAESIAAEWRAQGQKINPISMPLMQLAATAIDITRPRRAALLDEAASYANADLLCFYAEEPPELIARQKGAWQPVLDWCAGRFGAGLITGQGIMPVKQSPEAIKALRRALATYDDFTFTGVKYAAEVSGSLVLALALAEKHMMASQIFEAAELDALFQMGKWGEDPATAKRHGSILDDLIVCEKWFGLLG